MPFPIPPLDVTLHPIDPPSAEPREQAAVLDAVDGQSLTLTVNTAAVIESLAEWAKVDDLVMAWQDGDSVMTLPVTLREVDTAGRCLTAEVTERRTHLRVDSSLVFQHRLLSETEYVDLAPCILAQPLEYLEESGELERTWAHDEVWERLDIVLSNFHHMLREIAGQVERLITMQEGRDISEPPEQRCRVANISGAGLAFESEENLSIGTKMRMSFDLSRFPYRAIVCLGEVVRTEIRADPLSGEASHLIYVRFTHIREEDRDRIIHYVFRMQRRLLRHRRQEGDVGRVSCPEG